MLDKAELDWFAELNRGLRDELDDAGFEQRIWQCTQQLHRLAREIADIARAEHPDLNDANLKSLTGMAPETLSGPPLLAGRFDVVARNAA